MTHGSWSAVAWWPITFLVPFRERLKVIGTALGLTLCPTADDCARGKSNDCTQKGRTTNNVRRKAHQSDRSCPFEVWLTRWHGQGDSPQNGPQDESNSTAKGCANACFK